MDAALIEERPSRRIPNLLHVLLFLGLTVTLTFAVEFVTFVLARQPVQQTVLNQKLQLIVNGLVYVITLAASGVLFPALWKMSFRDGIRWNGAGARPLWAVLGLLLGLGAEIVVSHLPTPHAMPIDAFARTPGILWFLAIFGTVLAPLFEEVVFRGLLLPALANAWDWLRLPSAKTYESEIAHEQWRQADTQSTAALVVSASLTSIAFAGIHAPQLGYNWAPIALLFCVSLLLCAVRIRTGSVAASTLVHSFYNLADFALIFVASGGFRHLDR